MEDEEELDRILVCQMRKMGNVAAVLVQWKGVEAASATWEDYYNFRAIYP